MRQRCTYSGAPDCLCSQWAAEPETCVCMFGFGIQILDSSIWSSLCLSLLFSLGNSSPDDVNSFQFVVLVAALHQLTALSISLLTNPLHFTASLLLPSAFLLYFILLIKQLKTPLWYDQSWAPHWNWAPFQEERRQNQWHLSARMPPSQLARRKC